MKSMQLKVRYQLYDYNIKDGSLSVELEGNPRSQIMGRWTSYLGLELFNHKSMYERRKNMSGITLGNTVLPWAPLSIVKEDVNSNVHLSGNLEKKCHTTHYPKLCILGDTSGLV